MLKIPLCILRDFDNKERVFVIEAPENRREILAKRRVNLRNLAKN